MAEPSKENLRAEIASLRKALVRETAARKRATARLETEKKEFDETKHRRETQLRNLGDNLPDGVIYQVVRRPDGSNYFPYMSSGLGRTFGLRASDVMADANVVYRLVVPEDLARVRAAADESIRTGDPVDVEYRMRTPSGELRWMNLRGRPSALADGGTRWDVIALDISARKRAEEALRLRTEELRLAEERYRQLFERSFVGIFRTRPDGTLLECNDAFARILGYERASDLCQRSVVEHYGTAEDRDNIVAAISSGRDVVERELVARRRDGSLVPVAMSVRRVADQDGPVHEGTLLDLTDRKRAEGATALRSVAELANAAAHEINNPLTILVVALSRMREVGDSTGHLGRAQSAVARIDEIVKHMVRITRLERSVEFPGTNSPPMLDIRRSGSIDHETSV